MVERYCIKCNKVFIPAPQHVYKDEKGLYCSWHCYNHRNDKVPRKRWKSVEMRSLDGKQCRVFTSATEASEFMGFSASKIRDACRLQKEYNGYTWKYGDET